MVREKEACVKTMRTGNQTQICVKLESQIKTEERLDAIIISDKYVLSILMEMSDNDDSDADDN